MLKEGAPAAERPRWPASLGWKEARAARPAAPDLGAGTATQRGAGQGRLDRAGDLVVRASARETV